MHRHQSTCTATTDHVWHCLRWPFQYCPSTVEPVFLEEFKSNVLRQKGFGCGQTLSVSSHFHCHSHVNCNSLLAWPVFCPGAGGPPAKWQTGCICLCRDPVPASKHSSTDCFPGQGEEMSLSLKAYLKVRKKGCEVQRGKRMYPPQMFKCTAPYC